MTKAIFLLSFLLLSINVQSQQLNRVMVNGRIVVDSDDIEGVTVFNTLSNKGTITNEKGEFSIKVAVNDVLVFQALQFEEFRVEIDQEIIMSKQLTVFLVEKVNKCALCSINFRLIALTWEATQLVQLHLVQLHLLACRLLFLVLAYSGYLHRHF